MNIWLDVANSPQVLFFQPILRELEAQGHEVSVTLRDFAQTRDLADACGIEYESFGAHGGRNIIRTITANLDRARELAYWSRRRDFALAVSSNVYSHVLACAATRVPLVNVYDYDPNPANHLAFRLARRVVVPEPFPETALRKFGAGRKFRKYGGIKEQVYLADFVPTRDFRRKHELPEDRILVVMRPPSDWSPYHRHPNPLFDALLRHAAAAPEVVIVFLPRIPDQAEQVRALNLHNVRIPERVYDGPDLIYHTDLVISAGGTMNREAAVIGTPVYTVYGGELGATDRHLMHVGRLVHIRTEDEFSQVRFEKKIPRDPLVRRDLVPELVNLILGKHG
jgi:predicted glycosyltransferase